MWIQQICGFTVWNWAARLILQTHWASLLHQYNVLRPTAQCSMGNNRWLANRWPLNTPSRWTYYHPIIQRTGHILPPLTFQKFSWQKISHWPPQKLSSQVARNSNNPIPYTSLKPWFKRGKNIYMHIYMYIYVCMYMYNIYIYMCIYIYVYIYIDIHIISSVYIYIHYLNLGHHVTWSHHCASRWCLEIRVLRFGSSEPGCSLADALGKYQEAAVLYSCL